MGQLEKQETLNTAAGGVIQRDHTSQKAFSTAPAGDLTQICFSQNFQKEYINKRKGGGGGHT